MGILPIGFFAPLPLAIMIPFMAAQSFAMGHAFGTSFQYGKRKISSMTNEEFNALSATDLHGELQADIRAMIPNMNQSFKTMEQFQLDIISSMVNTLKLGAEQFFEWISTGKTGTEVSQTTTSASEFGNTDIAYAGSLGIPLGQLKGQNELNDKFLEEVQRLKDKFFNVSPPIPPPPEKKYIKTYTPPYQYDPYRKSKTAFASNEVKAKEKKEEITRLIKNVANLNAKIHNVNVQIKITLKKLDNPDRSKLKGYLITLKKQQNILKDLKKKLSNTMIQYKNAIR